MQTNRVCKTCGKKYFYCSNCDKKNNSPEWMLMWHDENCKNIWEIVSSYLQRQITIQEANAKLQKCNLKAVFSYPEKIRNIIEEILAVEKNVATKKKVEEKVETADVSREKPIPKRGRGSKKRY